MLMLGKFLIEMLIPSTGRKRVRFAWQIALICDGLYTVQVNAHLTSFLETSVYGASGSN